MNRMVINRLCLSMLFAASVFCCPTYAQTVGDGSADMLLPEGAEFVEVPETASDSVAEEIPMASQDSEVADEVVETASDTVAESTLGFTLNFGASFSARDFMTESTSATNKYRITWMRTNEGVKPYKVMDDLTFVGVPVFLAGIIAKSEKKAFRQNTQDNKHTLITSFKTTADNYTQYFGPVLATGLKLAGYEGRSDWGRYIASMAMSYGIMAILVNTIKYTSKEMRPDGSTRNSWPSGHTATAFVGATILHKEYGMTRSPLFSVAGYTVATATGIMRVLNNRHWVSDVLSGAGIGIMSTELAYALSDVFFKGRGLLRGDMSSDRSIIDHPSFFSVSMGIGFGSKNLNFDLESLELEFDGNKNLDMKFGASTAVGIEGAWFFNKYVGIGGRLRVNSAPVKGWSGITSMAWDDLLGNLYGDGYLEDEEIRLAVDGQGTPGQTDYSPALVEDASFVIKSDHLTEFSADLGVYFNLPLSKRFAVGSKLLVGRSIMQEVDLNAKVTGGKRSMTYNEVTDDYEISLLPGTYSSEFDYFTLGGNNTFKFGTGLSLTFAYKENYAWRLFFDYDYSYKTYKMTYNPYQYALDSFGMSASDFDEPVVKHISMKKPRHTFILGGSFTISF